LYDTAQTTEQNIILHRTDVIYTLKVSHANKMAAAHQ